MDVFEDFFVDFIEDFGIILDKYNYNNFLGRLRKWRDKFVKKVDFQIIDDIILIIESCLLIGIDVCKGELLIFLLIGSINDIDCVDGEFFGNMLE